MAHRRFGAFYARSFERRPWATLAIANGTLGAIADTLAQTLERYQKPASPTTSSSGLSQKIESTKSSIAGHIKEELPVADTSSWDVARTARFFAFGVMMAPLLAQWNNFIEYRFPLRSVGAVGSSAAKVSMAALAKRVSVDQLGL
jgi:protein Mpv17